MTCREFTERLPDHLDDALPQGLKRGLRRHVARCRSCRAYLAQYRATVETVRTLAEWDELESEETIDVSQLLSASMAAPVQ